MKGRVLVLGDRPGDAALMVDGKLEDLVLAPRGAGAPPDPGRTMTVEVTRTLPKGGAFCKLAQGGEGFMRDARGLTPGTRCVAQVVSLPEPGKAVTLTRRLLFKGPRLILTPDRPGVNVSRRIGNTAERDRLSAAMAQAMAGHPGQEQTGLIVRTAARGEETGILAQELDLLIEAAVQPQEGAGEDACSRPPADWLSPLPDAILATPDHARALKTPDQKGRLAQLWGDHRLAERLRAETAPFDAAGVSDAIDALSGPETRLSEGSMCLEATRALVAVDVNTGADFSPAAGLKTNLAAARDLPRQLRLRGLGGQIVVDFAPMPKQHRRALEDALGAAFRADPVETALLGWTSMGLFELQRKRERRPLHEVL